MKAKAIRCVSTNRHKCNEIPLAQTKKHEAHVMLAVVEDDCIYVKCPDQYCKRWNRIKISIPGVKLDFAKVAFTHDVMPKGFVFGSNFNLNRASPKRITSVIGER